MLEDSISEHRRLAACKGDEEGDEGEEEEEVPASRKKLLGGSVLVDGKPPILAQEKEATTDPEHVPTLAKGRLKPGTGTSSMKPQGPVEELLEGALREEGESGQQQAEEPDQKELHVKEVEIEVILALATAMEQALATAMGLPGPQKKLLGEARSDETYAAEKCIDESHQGQLHAKQVEPDSRQEQLSAPQKESPQERPMARYSKEPQAANCMATQIPPHSKALSKALGKATSKGPSNALDRVPTSTPPKALPIGTARPPPLLKQQSGEAWREEGHVGDEFLEEARQEEPYVKQVGPKRRQEQVSIAREESPQEQRMPQCPNVASFVVHQILPHDKALSTALAKVPSKESGNALGCALTSTPPKLLTNGKVWPPPPLSERPDEARRTEPWDGLERPEEAPLEDLYAKKVELGQESSVPGTTSSHTPLSRSTNLLPKGRARPPGPPPPRKAAPLPVWPGPLPSDDWKAERIINWQPIRQVSRWEGSVWQLVNERMREDGFEQLPDQLLQGAFMKKLTDPVGKLDQQRSMVTSVSHSLARKRKRRLSHQTALAADLLHAQLLRRGIRSPNQLQWVTGSRSQAGSEQVRCDVQELPVDILETLLGLLRAPCHGEEGQLHLQSSDDAMQLVPAEAFLQGLIAQAGPLHVLLTRTELALSIERFPSDAAAIEHELRIGLSATQAIIDSKALPMLLEGVLLLGNYVNSRSKALGGAVGVTLASLSRLAHTRCLPALAQQKQRRDGLAAKHDNALHLLLKHLHATRPSMVEALTSDLEGCLLARDLDPEATATALRDLVARVTAVEERCRSGCAVHEETIEDHEVPCPQALRPERLRKFLHSATPRIVALQQLSEELESGIAGLRRWLAEPSGTSFAEMMRSLLPLREALLSVTSLAALSQHPRPCRRWRAKPLLLRARSAPQLQATVWSHPAASAAERHRATSSPPDFRIPAPMVLAPMKVATATQLHPKGASAVGASSTPPREEHEEGHARLAPRSATMCAPLSSSRPPTGELPGEHTVLQRDGSSSRGIVGMPPLSLQIQSRPAQFADGDIVSTARQPPMVPTTPRHAGRLETTHEPSILRPPLPRPEALRELQSSLQPASTRPAARVDASPADCAVVASPPEVSGPQVCTFKPPLTISRLPRPPVAAAGA